MIVSIIAAMADGNRGIGYGGELPWDLPADLEHFRSVTMGHCLIMGRKTFESIGRPLPGRTSIILTRVGLQKLDHQSVEIASSIQEALHIAEVDHKETEAFIAGGGEIFQATLELGIVNRMYLTTVHSTVEADVFFPYYDPAAWTERWSVYYPADVENQYSFTMALLEKEGNTLIVSGDSFESERSDG
jgi:dihydrofolate reductase